MQKVYTMYKLIGETPLEALERFRVEQIGSARTQNDQTLGTFWSNIPMTYAGRLDPMAEGKLLILIGDECKNKERYLDLDKEYEIDILFGIETDTYDLLGLITSQSTSEALGAIDLDAIVQGLNVYIGPCTQQYPPYSSKTVDGKHLHELARAGSLPEEMPTKQVEIHGITLLKTGTITEHVLLQRITHDSALVHGDFRQEEILKLWRQNLTSSRIFNVLSIRVACSSGTYMRSLAHRIGADTGLGAIALSIKRTNIHGL